MTAHFQPSAGSSEPFQAFHRELTQAAQSDATVLLVGESGTGKGRAARALHEIGPRAARALVTASLAAVAPTLIESTLFGHEKGAFTDAHQARVGLFRQADGGTIVLEDVDLLPLEVQVKLLRVLQERTVEPLGAETPVAVDIRVVATTTRDLRDEVDAGRFREDLFYRLAVVTLQVPPLRARLVDLPELCEDLLGSVALRAGVARRNLGPEALARLTAYSWPGNVRELENALERVLVLGASGDDEIQAEEFGFLEEARAGVAQEIAVRALSHGLTVDTLTRAMMETALKEQRGNVSAAARQVGLTRRAFDYRLARGEGDDPA